MSADDLDNSNGNSHDNSAQGEDNVLSNNNSNEQSKRSGSVDLNNLPLHRNYAAGPSNENVDKAKQPNKRMCSSSRCRSLNLI